MMTTAQYRGSYFVMFTKYNYGNSGGKYKQQARTSTETRAKFLSEYMKGRYVARENQEYVVDDINPLDLELGI